MVQVEADRLGAFGERFPVLRGIRNGGGIRVVPHRRRVVQFRLGGHEQPRRLEEIGKCFLVRAFPQAPQLRRRRRVRRRPSR